MTINVFKLSMLITAAALVASGDAGAQQSCSQRDQVISLLAKKYQEAPVALGVTSTGDLLEVLSSGDGLSWTIVFSTPAGKTCLLAAGEGWRSIKADRSLLDPRS